MISHLRGTVIFRSPEEVVIESQGVGYGVIVPLNTYLEIPEVGESVELFINTQILDENIFLYGFSRWEERKVFELLISIPDIGPRTAINILSSIPWVELIQAVQNNNRQRLMAIPRIGKKSAEMIILKLKDKLSSLNLGAPPAKPPADPEQTLKQDAIQALISLGYQKSLAEKTVNATLASMPSPPRLEEVIKKSLQQLVR